MSDHKTVDNNWTWFTDYLYAYSEWTINAEIGREIEVGTGISFRGRPRGAKHRFRDYQVFNTIGIGAIHVRTVDGQGPCLVRLDQGRADPVVLKKQF